MIRTPGSGRPTAVQRAASSFYARAPATPTPTATRSPSEGVRHSAAPWTIPDHPRRAILIAYNHVTVRYHEPKSCMNPEVIGGLSAARQQFFRDVWILANARGKKR